MTTANLQPLIVTNWKAEGSIAGLQPYLDAVSGLASAARLVICPPFPLLAPLRQMANELDYDLCAQDCRATEETGSTGGVAAALLREIGCHYVLVGHADRRTHGDGDDILKSKLGEAAAAGLTPVFCVSDGEEQLVGQLMLLSGVGLAEVVVAYEPMWAIGSGRTPELGEIDATLTLIRQRAAKLLQGSRVQVLYGGSVTAENVAGIVGLPDCDGVLVGKAAYTGEGLHGILAAIAKTVPAAV